MCPFLISALVLLRTALADSPPSYDLQVPGKAPIRIIEAPNQPSTNFEQRAFHMEDEDERDALQEFLKNLRKNKYSHDDADGITKPTSNRIGPYHHKDEDRVQNWDLMQYEKHHHPYDDKKGWVSMEPVPWSVSKISKWQSSHKTTTPRPWSDDYDQAVPYKPHRNHYDNYNNRPTSSTLDLYLNRPDPVYAKPSAIYSQKVQVAYNKHKHDENCNHHHHGGHFQPEIITDGQPANFPEAYHSSVRRRGADVHPEGHPLSGEGDWVLLSTTKGYKYPPDRQRSMRFSSESVGVQRGVRLTVLPPLKGSKVNMTTSHGGLLQVESTFQTVEQAKNQYMKQKKRRRATKAPLRLAAAGTNAAKQFSLTPATSNPNKHDASAVLAAVGAGMIPATMAMLVPVALSGRRRKREAGTTVRYY